MEIIEKDSTAFIDIEDLLAEHPQSTKLEAVTGIDCDEEDMEAQRAEGIEDPMATIELFAQWNPNTKEGVLDWYYLSESNLGDPDSNVDHGGSLFAFRYTDKDPDFETLLTHAVEALNEVMEWAEFALDSDA